MNIGKAIKLILTSKGITQKQLSKKTGLSETSISLMLKGHTQPRKANIDLIAKSLRVQPELLLLLSLDRKDISKDKRKLYDLIWPQMESIFVNIFIK